MNIAQSQLRDYQFRLGKPFQQEAYLAELTTLRDPLKAKLSAGNPQAEDDTVQTTLELSEQIKLLKIFQHAESALNADDRRRSVIASEIPVSIRIQKNAKADRLGNKRAFEVLPSDFPIG